MLKKHMAACLVATAFMAAPALAQTSPAPGSTPPMTTSPTTSSPPMAASGSASAMSGKFMTLLEKDQIRGSKLMGVAIYGSNNDRIGDVNEVILDRTGKVDGVVIGVGGFLGIGEKNVALPFDAVQWMWDRDAASTAATRSTAPGAATTATGTNTTASGTTAPAAGTTAGQSNMAATNQPGMTTGTAGTASGTASRPTSTDNRGAPERGTIQMSKADLQNAPRFAYDPSDATSNRANTAPAGTTNAPRQ